MLMNWKKYFIASPVTPSCVLSQFLCYKSLINLITSLSTCSVAQQKTLILSPNYFTLLEQTKAGTI